MVVNAAFLGFLCSSCLLLVCVALVVVGLLLYVFDFACYFVLLFWWLLSCCGWLRIGFSIDCGVGLCGWPCCLWWVDLLG